MKSLGIEKIPADAGSLSDYNNGMTERRFSPYADNGGSVVAIAGDDFVVIASDTRLSGRGWVEIIIEIICCAQYISQLCYFVPRPAQAASYVW